MVRRKNNENKRTPTFLENVDNIDLSQLSADELDLLQWMAAQRSDKLSGPKSEHTYHVKEDLAIFFTVGDLHIGSASTDMRAINKLQHDILSTPNAYLLLLGDEIEGWVKKYTNNLTKSLPLDKQIKAFQRFLRPLYEQGRVIGMVAEYFGHPGWTADAGGIDIWKVMLGDMDDIPLLANGAKINFKRKGRTVYTLRAFHQPPGKSQWDPVHGARRGIDLDVDGAASAHLHAQGVESSGGKIMIASGTDKGSNTELPLDPLGVRLGLPPTSPNGQGFILRRGKGKEVKIDYPFVDQDMGLMLLSALELWNDHEHHGTTKERVGELRHQSGELTVGISKKSTRQRVREDFADKQDREKRTAKALAAHPEIGDTQSAYFAKAYEAPYRDLILELGSAGNTNLPISIEFLANLRLGSSSAQLRQFRQHIEHASQDSHRVALWMRNILDKEAGNLHNRRELLDKVVGWMNLFGDRNLALLVSESLRRASWKQAVGDGEDSLPVPPATYLSQMAHIPLVDHQSTVRLRLTGNKTEVPIAVFDKLGNSGSMEKSVYGLQSNYNRILRHNKPAVAVGGHMPGSGWARSYDGGNRYTNHPVFIAPGWWSQFDSLGKGNVMDGGTPGYGLIMMPIGSETVLVPVNSPEQHDLFLEALTLYAGLAANGNGKNGKRTETR